MFRSESSSPNETKAQLLQRARAEREKRKHIARQLKAAKIIQRHWRGYRQAAAERKSMRDEWDNLWSLYTRQIKIWGKAKKTKKKNKNNEKIKESARYVSEQTHDFEIDDQKEYCGKAEAELVLKRPLDILTKLVRILVLMYSPRMDQKRLLSVCAAILTSCKTSDSDLNYFSPAIHSELGVRLSWATQLRQFSRLVLGNCARVVKDNTASLLRLHHDHSANLSNPTINATHNAATSVSATVSDQPHGRKEHKSKKTGSTRGLSKAQMITLYMNVLVSCSDPSSWNVGGGGIRGMCDNHQRRRLLRSFWSLYFIPWVKDGVFPLLGMILVHLIFQLNNESTSVRSSVSAARPTTDILEQVAAFSSSSSSSSKAKKKKKAYLLLQALVTISFRGFAREQELVEAVETANDFAFVASFVSHVLTVPGIVKYISTDAIGKYLLANDAYGWLQLNAGLYQCLFEHSSPLAQAFTHQNSINTTPGSCLYSDTPPSFQTGHMPTPCLSAPSLQGDQHLWTDGISSISSLLGNYMQLRSKVRTNQERPGARLDLSLSLFMSFLETEVKSITGLVQLLEDPVAVVKVKSLRKYRSSVRPTEDKSHHVRVDDSCSHKSVRYDIISRIRMIVAAQIRILLDSDVIASFLSDALEFSEIDSKGDLSIQHLLSSYSLSNADGQCNRLLVTKALKCDFEQPTLLISIFRLYQVCLERFSQQRLTLTSTLCFSSPLLICCWAWLEKTVGTPLDLTSSTFSRLAEPFAAGNIAPTHRLDSFSSSSSSSSSTSAFATASSISFGTAASSFTYASPEIIEMGQEFKDTAVATFSALQQEKKTKSSQSFFKKLFGSSSSSSSSLSSSSSSSSSSTSTSMSNNLSEFVDKEARLHWLESLLISPQQDSCIKDAFMIFSMCIAPVLFVLDADELITSHPPFSSLHTLRQYTKLIKTAAFQLIWNKDRLSNLRVKRGLQTHTVDVKAFQDLLTKLHPILHELYRRDINCKWMGFDEDAFAQKASSDHKEQKKKKRKKKKGGEDGKSGGIDDVYGCDTDLLVNMGKEWLLDTNVEEWTTEWNRWLAGERAATTDGKGLTAQAPQRIMNVLNEMPYVVSFLERARLLRILIQAERRQTGATLEHRPVCEFKIRRNNVIDDAFVQVMRIGNVFKSRVKVKFIGEGGEEEKGIDLGGVFKEFLEILSKEMFRLDYGLFVTTDDGLLYPNPSDYIIPGYYELMTFVGRVVGKAFYEGILLGQPFAPFFLAKLINQPCCLTDLRTVNPELYKHLLTLKYYEGDVANDLCLTFCILDDSFGDARTIELRNNGADIEVTKDNRLEYIHKVADYHLERKIRQQSRAFVRGLADIINIRWIRMFNTSELQVLLSGTSAGIDVDDWCAHTRYDHCSARDKTITRFWKVVRTILTSEERSGLLSFATSCSRPPLMGFETLQPPFTIRVVPLHSNDDAKTGGFLNSIGNLFRKTPVHFSKLPSASTCFNLLKLPAYPSSAIMAEKIRQAIVADGFHLS